MSTAIREKKTDQFPLPEKGKRGQYFSYQKLHE
jgi:hypothetical protein